MLSFFRFFQRILNSTEPLLLVLVLHSLPFVDRDLCDRESDMPWGIQMCMVSLIIVPSCPSAADQLSLLNSFTHAAIAYYTILSPQDDTATTFKQVHRTQPILSYIPSILDPKNMNMNMQQHQTKTNMPEKKESKHSMAFGLPREKVREFMKSHNLMHWKVPRSTPTLYP